MHLSVHEFAARMIKPSHVRGQRVLDVGSYDVNGTLRPFIETLRPRSYLGVDLREGPGVDRVRDACEPGLTLEVGRHDLVICTEMLEHAQDWRAAVTNLKECVALPGRLLVTTRSFGMPLHDFPSDYWRFELDDMRRIFADFAIVELALDPGLPGVMMYAQWYGLPPADLSGVELHAMERPEC